MPDIDALVAGLGSDDQAADYRAHKALLEIVSSANAPGQESQRREVADKLAAELNATVKDGDKVNAKHGDEARRQIAQLLSYVGGGAQVPALAEGLKDLDLREMCCLALDANPSAEATAALIDALAGDVGPEFLIGVIAALGRREGSGVVAALGQAVESDDPRIAGSAAEALANFPVAESDALIEKLARSGAPRARACANRARIRLAETLRVAGQKDNARRIYQAVQSGSADEAQKKAAQLGLAALA